MKNPNLIYIFGITLFILLFQSCKEDVYPKPKGFLKLDYPTPNYISLQNDCPYTFEYSDQATLFVNKKCWIRLAYPKLKANLHITYRPVHNNLREILNEVQRLTTKHTIKADAIERIAFDNPKNHVYGAIMHVDGNAASNIQFYATDSTRNVLSGALYFETAPKFDSILPAIRYIEKDVIKLMETIQWK